ncbi:Peptidase family M50 [Cardinium endosymbiont of Sogatella furcifera]|uniref:metalloprotease n=1 Tax=Cardinium endosymbiont of Sogatella furcifera TaxID=650378 RepID=UPI000E108E7D|nr:site-2 protease family protein [Cardinium endosymbiont of Sogatella furcifera]AXI24077.1 Peptidase family M50 [Cardinium endosymbiont of Sogatella furcifera]
MLRFRFLKVSVTIDLSYWIFLLLVMGSIGGRYTESLLWSSIFTFSILIHEYGHALTALFFGATPTVVLQALGGRTIFNESQLTDKQKFFITLAGPLFQGLLTLVAYLLLQCNMVSGYLLNYLLSVTMYINSRWLLLNLIPIAPLDGGWLVRYILEKKFGHKGYVASLIIGLTAAAIAIPCFYLQGYHWFFIMQLFICGWHYCKRLEQEW